MMLQAQSLALTGIRHAFFTRAGGVSSGVYASLNGGTGSKDDTDHVAENRARMAAAPGPATVPGASKCASTCRKPPNPVLP